jgi:hypothetical protein
MIIAKRKQWFRQWLSDGKVPSQQDILDFHLFTGDGDCHNDLKMNRGQVFTVSVTSLAIAEDKVDMHYLDLINNQAFQQELLFEKSMAGK